MSGLRNEEYVAFLDESGEPGIEIVSGVLIPARWLRPAERRWRAFIQNELGSRSGKTEVKSRDLANGKGVSFQAQKALGDKGLPPMSAKGAGRHFYRLALRNISSIAEVRILTVGLPTKYPIEVYRLWFWMVYAALTEQAQDPRPRLPLTVIDGEDQRFRQAQDLVAHRFYRAFPIAQPYMKSGPGWFVGGAVHQDSALHPFVQMADLVAGVGRHSVAGRVPLGPFYREHLIEHPAKLKSPRDPDISERALNHLKALDPKNQFGSGWPNALLPG